MNEDTNTLFEPDWIAPSQYFDARRSASPYQSERRLWREVLEMALRDWAWANGQTSYGGGGQARPQPRSQSGRCTSRERMRAELSAWFSCDAESWGTFRWTCDALGLNAEAIRAKLLGGASVVLKRSSPSGRCGERIVA